MKVKIQHFLYPFLLLPFVCLLGQDEPGQWTRFRGSNGQGILQIINGKSVCQELVIHHP